MFYNYNIKYNLTLFQEINEDVNIKIDTTEFVSEKSTEKADIEKINVDTSNICENNEDVDDKNDISSNSDVAILVDSIPIKVKLDNNSSVSVSKTPTPKRIFKKQESAKKQEERLRLKQVVIKYYDYLQVYDCII